MTSKISYATSDQLLDALPKYIGFRTTLNKLAEKDTPGIGAPFTANPAAIDVDGIEHSRGAITDNTMDALIGVRGVADEKLQRNAKGLLIELKLNVETVNGVSCTQLVNKNEHTKTMFCSDVELCERSFVIYNQSMYAKARSIINRRSQTK